MAGIHDESIINNQSKQLNIDTRGTALHHDHGLIIRTHHYLLVGGGDGGCALHPDHGLMLGAHHYLLVGEGMGVCLTS